MVKQLSTRQWKLHNYLEEMGKLDPNRYISKEEIVLAIPEYGFKEYQSEHNSTAYARIRHDKIAINECDVPHKTIISSKRGYKLMSTAEKEIWKKQTKAKILKQFKRYWDTVGKLEKDGQVTTLLESKARKPVIISFIDEEVTI